MIMQFSLYNSPIPLVLRDKFHSKNFDGFSTVTSPERGVKQGWSTGVGWGKLSPSFTSISQN